MEIDQLTLMKRVYLAIKYYPDHSNRPDVERISWALEQNGFDTVCVARDLEQWGTVRFSPADLMTRSFAEIDSSDVVVMELSAKGVGLGIEAGYAYARHIPIVTIARTGSDISTTLQGISQQLFWYDEIEDLLEFFARLD